MASSTGKALFCYCRTGGHLVSCPDGSIKYEGGTTEGVGIDESTQYEEFVAEVCGKLNIASNTATIKYTIKYNNRLPVTLHGQRDLQNIIRFNDLTTEVYVLQAGESLEILQMPSSGSVTVSPSTKDLGRLDSSASDAGTRTEPLSSVTWEEDITGEGQLFKSVVEFRLALNKYSLAHRFAYIFIKNDRTRVKAKCAVEDCNWKVFASKVRKTNQFVVYKYESEHSHKAEDNVIAKLRTSKQVISSIVIDKVRDTPGYQAMEIVKDLWKNYDIRVSYKQAWRGKEIAKEEIHGTTKDSYKRLPWFCQRIMESNPGSIAIYTEKEDSSFNQLFVAFHASLHGFRVGCRPILFIDGIWLKAPSKATLLAATAVDADNGIFPIAFAVVCSQSYEDWKWFLDNLKTALSYDKDIIFVSDKNTDILRSVEEVFGSSFHSHCYRHLEQNFMTYVYDFHLPPVLKKSLKDAFHRVAYARVDVDYNKAMQDIMKILPEAHNWVVEQQPERWANSKFSGRRYDLLTFNHVESYSKWLGEAQDMPIVGLVDKIRQKIMEMMNNRRSEVWKCPVGEIIEETLKKNIIDSQKLDSFQSSAHEYEVRGGMISHRINLLDRTCSCKDWYITGLPCVHACEVLKKLHSDVYLYVDECYKRETQVRIYSEAIRPLCTYDMPSVDIGDGSEPLANLQPPLTLRQPGRPKKKRIKLQEVEKRPIHCSRCYEEGHNRLTCKTPI